MQDSVAELVRLGARPIERSTTVRLLVSLIRHFNLEQEILDIISRPRKQDRIPNAFTANGKVGTNV
jgi:hypothetical protein